MNTCDLKKTHANLLIGTFFASLTPAVFAGSILVDDFSEGQRSGSMAGPAMPGSSYWTNRVLTVGTISGNIPSGSSIIVINGQLQIDNGGEATATNMITWNLDLSGLGAALQNITLAELTLDQIDLDVNTVEVTGPGVLRTTSDNGTSVRLYSGLITNLINSSTSNRFTVSFGSALEADSKWDNLRLRYTCQPGAETITAENIKVDGCGTVPLPGSLPLLALGILGFAALRSRKTK